MLGYLIMKYNYRYFIIYCIFQKHAQNICFIILPVQIYKIYILLLILDIRYWQGGNSNTYECYLRNTD